jgi:hypothetical protein
LVDSAISFVGQFTPGFDKVGLITFATSAYVDFPIANTFQDAKPNIPSLLSHMDCAGSTSSAQALWAGYQQLIGLGQPEAVNVILFFTDGNPTGAVFDMPVATSSPCREFTPGSPEGPGAYTMPPSGKGYIRGVFGSFTNISLWFGLLDPSGEKGADGLRSIAGNDLWPTPHSAGCAYASNWSNNVTNTSDVLGVPTKDIFGNSADTAFRPVTLNSYGLIDLANAANARAAPMNAADSAASNIRSGAIDSISGRGLSNVIIYSIGLGNAPFPLSPAFLMRASNDPRSSTFNVAEPMGLYLGPASVEDLDAAFLAVATRIFRLAE